SCRGSKEISGGGPNQDEELLFELDHPVLAADIVVGLNKIKFTGCGDDDPVIFVSSDGSSGFDYVIEEPEIQAAFTSTGSERGTVDFGSLTSLPAGLLIDMFKIRETSSHIVVDRIEVMDSCDDGNICTDDSCDPASGCVYTDNTDPCDDGLFCTVGETCTYGVCNGGEPRDCSELDDDCNVGVCNEETDSCEAEPVEDGTPCDDGLFCTGRDTCRDGVCERGAFPCPPGYGCHEDTDTCGPCVTDEHCDDGLFCNGVETCTNSICRPGVFPCAPGEICDESTDSCGPCVNDAQCDDGLFCNGVETCVEGVCEAGLFPCAVGEGCDESTDSCGPCVTDAQCDDGLFCNGVETCAEG
ncbi:unnamed protein product, partial [marine sediment metagenome]